jgi:prepilin-type N-terminal cleavage/methylation domain-containing protein
MLRKMKKGLTMPEILIVVAIVALLAAGLLFVSNKAKSQADTQLVQDTLTLLDTALQQYYDQTHTYPPDCNDFNLGQTQTALQTALNFSSVSITAGGYNQSYSGISAMYFCVNRIPQSRVVLEKLDTKFLTSKDTANADMTINIDGVAAQTYPFFRIVDPWGTPLRYSRLGYPTNMTNFPRIESAGPDKVFGTPDDIVNKKN